MRSYLPVLDLDLYNEHMPEERITGSKLTQVDLYVSIYGNTYTDNISISITVYSRI